MYISKMTELSLQNKRVLIRADLNVPLNDGKITSDTRIRAILPTLRLALQQGAHIMLMSHLGRPKEGEYDAAYSLEPVAIRLAELLQHPVRLQRDWLEGLTFTANEIILCENVRFNRGEKSDDDALAKKMASLCDVFVMDAFATAHRAQASTHGVAKYAPIACAGPLLVAEIAALSKVVTNMAAPVVAIIGGSKVSTKLSLLESLLEKVDYLIVGGGIANTFMAASGLPIGKSLVEIDLISQAQRMLQTAKERNIMIPIPTDVVVATEFSASAKATIKAATAVTDNDMILDVGPQTAEHLASLLKAAATIIWNGPVGVFEFPAFSHGTEKLAQAIAASSAYSVAGGGDTLAAIEQFAIADKLSYISTGGGAFLEFVEGRALPGLTVLEERGI